MESTDRTPQYQENSLSLLGAIALGTGVMIGAGIFALTGQMAEMTGKLFPLAFLSSALVVAFSAYSYVKMSNAYPSAGGIQSFLARTFGSYTLELFDVENRSLLVPSLVVALLLTAFLINLAANRLIQGVASVLGFVKIGGIIVFGVVGVIVADSVGMQTSASAPEPSLAGFLGATALGIFASDGGEAGSWRDRCLVHRHSCHAGHCGWHHCQYLCGFTHAGNVDGNETGAASPLSHARQYSKAYPSTTVVNNH